MHNRGAPIALLTRLNPLTRPDAMFRHVQTTSENHMSSSTLTHSQQTRSNHKLQALLQQQSLTELHRRIQAIESLARVLVESAPTVGRPTLALQFVITLLLFESA